MAKKTSEAKTASPTRKSRTSWSNLVLKQDKFSAGKRVSSLWELQMPNELKKNYNKPNTHISFDIFSLQELAFPGFPKPERVYWNLITLNGFSSVHLSKCFLNLPKLSVVTTSSSERFHNLITGLACCMRNCLCTFVWTYFFHIIWWQLGVLVLEKTVGNHLFVSMALMVFRGLHHRIRSQRLIMMDLDCMLMKNCLSSGKENEMVK